MNQETQNTMISLNILLPQSIKEFIDQQTARRGLDTPGDYVYELVKEAQERLAEERIEQLLLEAIDSGAPIEVTPEYWENKRAELIEKYGNSDVAG